MGTFWYHPYTLSDTDELSVVELDELVAQTDPDCFDTEALEAEILDALNAEEFS